MEECSTTTLDEDLCRVFGLFEPESSAFLLSFLEFSISSSDFPEGSSSERTRFKSSSRLDVLGPAFGLFTINLSSVFLAAPGLGLTGVGSLNVDWAGGDSKNKSSSCNRLALVVRTKVLAKLRSHQLSLTFSCSGTP